MQVRSLSCVVVDLLVKECNWFTSSIAPRHWIVALRKHVFPVFRNPRPDFVGKGLLSAFRSGSRGSRDVYALSTFLRAESCLVSAPCLGVGAWGGVMRLTAGVRFLGSGVGSGRACDVEFCFVSCSGLFLSVFFPASFLSSYFVRFSVLSSLSLSLFPGPVILRRVFSHLGQDGGWSISPLFVASSTPTTVQAYYFIYCVAYCCHPAPCLFDVGLLNKVNLLVPHRICAEDCIYTKCQSGLLRVCGIILLRCPWLLQFYPVLSGWIRGLDPG